jgi:maltooligosyltrehalose synthase
VRRFAIMMQLIRITLTDNLMCINDPRYGTNEDYARLAAEMHKRKMKLVMDYVTNHGVLNIG